MGGDKPRQHGAMPVVPMNPTAEFLKALIGVLVGAGIGPFTESGLNEAFGLPVGSWRVRPRKAILRASGLAGGRKTAGAVGRTVVGQHGTKANT